MAQAMLAPGQAVRIRCKACNWNKRVDPRRAGEEMLFHRDIECAGRLQPGRPTTSHMSLRPAKKGLSRRTTRRFCPTCRDEMTFLRDAFTCPAGCSNEAIRSG